MLGNSKGKLFNKVSIIDIFVIIIIIVVAVGAYFRFNGNNVVTENAETEFYYTISIKGIRESNKNLLEKSLNTKFRLDGKVDSTMGELVDVQVSDAKTLLSTEDGAAKEVTIPEKYDVVLTLKVNGSISDLGYFTPEMQEICVGKQYNIVNINCAVGGLVNKIWVN